ncbi:putative monooxygenase [Astrocystis sublimbata]|nr:putative monooxygenase [Astrocystis sublimbata]
MDTIETDILIIGGGIGGLTLATICRKLGIKCKILERTKTLQPVGAGISLAPNALKLLDHLGLYDEILKHGQKVRELRVLRNTTYWRSFDWTTCEAMYGYPLISMERHHFHRMLYSAAGAEETVLLNRKAEAIVDDLAQPMVRVLLSDGTEARGRVVVGADGIRSMTRRVLAGWGKDETMNTIRFTGRVHMSGITSPLPHLGSEDIGVGHWMLYDDCILTTWPCPDNQQWFIGAQTVDSTRHTGRSVWSDTTPETVSKIYGAKFHPFAEKGSFREIVDRSERVVASDVFEEVAFPSMSKGRVALLGDAAHSMTSFFGQGGCQAMEDAAVLGSLLRERLNAGGPEDLVAMLEEYSRKREPRVKDLAKFSSNFALLHTGNLSYGLGRLVRRLVYRFFPSWVLMWYLGWLYSFQPTVEGLQTTQTLGKH